jgi:ankyrin repeat protein
MLRKNMIGAGSLSLLGILAVTIVLAGAPVDTRVADAAMSGDLDAVRSLLREAADVNSAQGDGMTALHWTAFNGDTEIAETLLYAGANVKATTRLGAYTPLYLASEGGHAGVVNALLGAGADANLTAFGGVTPLMMAASSGEPEVVELLIAAGAKVDAAEDGRGQTPLIFAAAFNRTDVIGVLLEHGANLDQVDKKFTPPERRRRGGQQVQATRGNRGRRGQQAAQAAPPPDPPEQPAEDPPEDPDAEEDEEDEEPAEPELSMDKGNNPKGELTPLMYAAREGSLDAVRTLVEAGADLDKVSADESTALLIATINGHFDIAKHLVEAGADVNIASVDGATPLYGVVNIQWARKTFHPQPTTFYQETQYLDLMKLMLDKGADPNRRLVKDLWYIEFTFSLENTNASGTTAFWKAAAVGDDTAMRLLAEHGADPSIPNIEGVTPFLIASAAGFHGNDEITTPQGRMPAVRYLVEEFGADVNQVDTGPPPGEGNNQFGGRRRLRGGVTALHNAAGRGDNEMILYLVSQGARVDSISKNGTTIADMANGSRQRVQPYPETLALLKLLGAPSRYKCVSC